MRENEFDVTIFEADDLIPFFGLVTVDEDDLPIEPFDLLEADFSTDPAHPRPYLREIKNWSATEIDFAEGASTIGGLSIEIVDVPLDPGNKRSGILTSRLGEIQGRRILLRRRHHALGMVTAFDGVIQGYKMGGAMEGLVVITITLRDFRERERKQSLFTSNFVLYGKGGAQGSPIDYGALPSRNIAALLGAPQPHLLEKVPPYETTDAPFQHHYQGGLPFGDGQGGPLAWSGYIGAPNSGDPFNLGGDIGMPTQDVDGTYYYRRFQVWWRLPGDDETEWRKLKNMPRRSFTINGIESPGGTHAVDWNSNILGTYVSLYLASYDADLQPPQGVPLEILIVATEITEDTPFFWDGGTHGDLLREIYDGEHSLDPVRIRYNPEAMQEFADRTPPARMILTEPVEDMREWVEKNIYAPMGWAPAFDQEKRVMPVPWAFPLEEQDYIPLITTDEITPIGDWEHTDDSVVNAVDFTYLRESVASQEVTKEKKTKKFLGFIPYGSKTVTHVGTLSPWERFFTTEVQRPRVDVDSASTFGTKKISLTPIALRSTGDVNGAPATGDTQDELGTAWADRLTADITHRFRYGVVKFRAMCERTSVVQELHEGSWCRVDIPYMPNYTRGVRGTRRYMQVYAISDEDPILRELLLVDSGIPDLSEDPETVDPVTGGCLEASALGVPVTTPIRQSGYYFRADSTITNNCTEDIILPNILLVAGGGAGGAGSTVGGGGGAGGVLTAKNVRIAPAQVIPLTVGVGGLPTAGVGESGGDTVLWVDRVTGMALDPLTDSPDLGYRARGGGGGGSGSSDGEPGGNGGGGGGILPISGGGANNGGAPYDPDQGRPGGLGGDAGGIATCRAAAGGGGGSFFGRGMPGSASSPGGFGGPGGPSGSLSRWGVRLGGGGGGGFGQKPGALGADICGPELYDAGDDNLGIGMGGGGGANTNGSPGTAGVAIIAYKGLRPPVLASPNVSSTEVLADNKVRICITEEDWPILDVPSYRVRVDYALSANAMGESPVPELFADTLARPQPYATAGYTPSDVSPLSGAPATGYDFPQPAQVHREFAGKWEEMFSSRWDIDGGINGAKARSAPGGRIPKPGGDMAAYTAAGGVLPGGIPAAFYGALIRPVVDLPTGAYVFDITMEGGSINESYPLLVLFNFDPSTGNGYGIDIGDGGIRGMRKITGWVVTGVGLNFGFGPGDVPPDGWGAARKLRVITRPGVQIFQQLDGDGRAERNDVTYDPSNGGIYVWDADGAWDTVGYPQASANYAFSTLRVWEDGAELSGGTQPAEDSPGWLLAGYLDAPGCVTTIAVPTGSVVITKATAEAPNFPPSVPTVPDYTEQVPETPDVLRAEVEINADGSVTVRWTPNAFMGMLRLRALVHSSTEDASPPLPVAVVQVPADLGELTIPGFTVAEDQYVTVDFEAWEELLLPEGNAPIYEDTFTQPDLSEPVSPPWFERDINWFIQANRLRTTGGPTTEKSTIEAQLTPRGKWFVQSLIDASITGAQETDLAARWKFHTDKNDQDGYFLRPDPTFPGFWRIMKSVLGVETTLVSAASPSTLPAGGGNYPAQLYVADGVQEAQGEGVNLAAADVALDGTLGTVAYRWMRGVGAPSGGADDFIAMPDKNIYVRGLPAGFKAKVLNAITAVVKSANAVAGIATLDCSMFSGVTELVPIGGWPTIAVYNAADVEQARYEQTGVYPGLDITYDSVMMSLSGPLSGPGRVRRVTEYRPVDEVAANAEASASDLLSKLVLNDDLDLVVDDDLIPIREN